MSVLRKRLSDEFTVVPNELLNDRTLDLCAKGLVAYMLSKPDGWKFSAERIASELPEGRDAIRSALRRAEEAGWVLRQDRRTLEGRYHREILVRNSRQVSWVGGADSPTTENPTPGSPTSELRNMEVKTETASTDKQELKDEPRTSPSFDVFWNVYPRHAGKKHARAAFQRACLRADPADIIEGALRYHADPNREDEFTAHPTTWLNRDGWEDDPLPARGSISRHGVDRAVRLGMGGGGDGRADSDRVRGTALRGLPRPQHS